MYVEILVIPYIGICIFVTAKVKLYSSENIDKHTTRPPVYGYTTIGFFSKKNKKEKSHSFNIFHDLEFLLLLQSYMTFPLSLHPYRIPI